MTVLHLCLSQFWPIHKFAANKDLYHWLFLSPIANFSFDDLFHVKHTSFLDLRDFLRNWFMVVRFFAWLDRVSRERDDLHRIIKWWFRDERISDAEKYLCPWKGLFHVKHITLIGWADWLPVGFWKKYNHFLKNVFSVNLIRSPIIDYLVQEKFLTVRKKCFMWNKTTWICV